MPKLDQFPIWILLIPCLITQAWADQPIAGNPGLKLEGHEIMQAEPSEFIMHGLELKGSLDADKIWTNLRGPRYFSKATWICDDTQQPASQLQQSFQSWYEIAKPKQVPSGTIKVNVNLRLKQYHSLALQTVPVGEVELRSGSVVLFDLSFFGRRPGWRFGTV